MVVYGGTTKPGCGKKDCHQNLSAGSPFEVHFIRVESDVIGELYQEYVSL